MNHDSIVIYENISQAVTMAGVAKKQGRHVKAEDLAVINKAAMVVEAEEQKILWVGKQAELPEVYENVVNRFSGEGEVWLPELIECHTHLIFAGNRHHDYLLRCEGKTYQQVAQEGGGILSTIKPTRAASLKELKEGALQEIERFMKYGVGTIEIKSGYGLNLETELKMLEVIHQISQEISVNLVPTFLPAHAVPPEYKGKTEEYVDLICKEWIPTVAKDKLAVFFDAFVEEGYFTAEQTRKMCLVAKDHGLKIKLHTDQFTDQGGTALGLELGAQSLDHLEQISDANIKKLGTANTVAVMCPGASLFTNTGFPPARKLIDAGARVALSTDYNPGTCPSRNLPLMTTLACSQMKLTIPEALAGVTCNAAAALGMEDSLGVLAAGKPFRVTTLKADSYEVLPYCFGELE